MSWLRGKLAKRGWENGSPETDTLVFIIFALALIIGGLMFATIARADGALEPISQSGIATGWAMDAKFPNGKESVWLYDKPKASGGKLLGIVQATLPSPDIQPGSSRRFSFALPATLKDGAAHTVHAYRAGSELLAIPRDFLFGEKPGLALSQTALTFANQNVGTTGAAQTVTITNSGNMPLQIAAVVTTGDFAVTSQCVSPVSAGASCAVAVTFSPKGVGGGAGSISIESNASGSPHVVSLAGVGVAVVVAGTVITSTYDVTASDYQISITINGAGWLATMVMLNEKTIFTDGPVFTPAVFVVPVGFCACGILPQYDYENKRAAFKIVIPVEAYTKFKVSLNGNVLFAK